MFFALLLSSSFALQVLGLASGRVISTYERRSPGGIHLPIVRTEKRDFTKRDPRSANIGLGDVLDVTYNVLVQIGDIQTPLVLDSGSADLWVISDGCVGNCTQGVPVYPQATLQDSGLDVHLFYGDSRTGTHASGPIGKDNAGVAGLTVQDQYFAAITDTNTTVLETGSAGIFGIGLPAISVLWRELLQAELNGQPPSVKSSRRRQSHAPWSTRLAFPTFDFIRSVPSLEKRQNDTSFQSATKAVESFGKYGSLPSRMVSENILKSPIIAVTMQRDTVDIGGNVGMLSLGELPAGVEASSLTWVPIRGYTPQEGGLPPSPEAPDEVYPLLWEIPIDNVYFDGEKLPRSNLSSPSISLSALIDSGNSLVRGPEDVLEHIQRTLGGANFDCSIPHNLTFEIGGRFFPIDPRDFIHQSFEDTVDLCESTLAVTDPPTNGSGFLNSWSLGDPFLKSALVAFYYGNLTHPSVDPPKVGLLSTVPSSAGDRLQQIVDEAQRGDGNFELTSEIAPSGVPTATSTGIGGDRKSVV